MSVSALVRGLRAAGAKHFNIFRSTTGLDSVHGATSVSCCGLPAGDGFLTDRYRDGGVEAGYTRRDRGRRLGDRVLGRGDPRKPAAAGLWSQFTRSGPC